MAFNTNIPHFESQLSNLHCNWTQLLYPLLPHLYSGEEIKIFIMQKCKWGNTFYPSTILRQRGMVRAHEMLLSLKNKRKKMLTDLSVSSEFIWSFESNFVMHFFDIASLLVSEWDLNGSYHSFLNNLLLEA